MRNYVLTFLLLAPIVLLSISSTSAAPSFYSFEVKNIEGQPVPMSAYKGKVLLIVNTASRCGFTPQYEALQKVYNEFKDQGLVVLGFPSNNFGGQEPGSNDDIRIFCEQNYKVSFPLFSKIDVKGKSADPLFQFLTTQAGGGILWNFEKFLISRDGKLIDRFRSMTRPDSPSILEKIKKALEKS